MCDEEANDIFVGEAIWNACLGTTALAVNVHLPNNEVMLLAGLAECSYYSFRSNF